MFSHSTCAIDFRLNHLVITLLKKTFSRIRLVDCAVYPLVSESQKDEWETLVISLITSFLGQHSVPRDRVCLSIPREKVVARFLRLPLATRENLRQVLEYEAPKHTPFGLGEFYFDYQICRVEKEWVHLFAVFVKKQEVEAYLSLLRKIGLHPHSIQIPSAAALNLFFYHRGARAGEVSVLVEVGERFCAVDLVQGTEWKESFHLPLTGEGREKGILEALKKVGWNGSGQCAVFVHGLEAAESMIPALQAESFVRETSFPPWRRIEAGRSGWHPERFYASLGLALKGLAPVRFDLNLMPQEMRRKARQIGRPVCSFLAVLAFALAVSWGAGVYATYRNELRAVRAEVNKRKPEVEAIEKLQRQREALSRELTELERLKSGEISKIEVLRELTQILPPTVWIWNLRYTGREVELSGFADSASDLISILDKSALFERVEFMAPVTKERERRPGGEKEKERFKIKARLEGRPGGSG